jgi:hypothetical protein
MKAGQSREVGSMEFKRDGADERGMEWRVQGQVGGVGFW